MKHRDGRCASPTVSTLALAVWVVLGTGVPAQAQTQYYSSTGAVSSTPVNAFPINTSTQTLNLGANTLQIGPSAPGSFSAMAGALLNGAGVSIANGGTGNGAATVTGAGTQVTFGGTANRLEIGNWGTGSLTVSSGALVDAAGACTVGASCYTFVGNAAGSTGTLTVTGAGSELRALRVFGVGQTAVFTQARDGFTFGTPGGTTNAFINVLDGGTLRTQQANVGSGPGNAGAIGTERGFGTVVIDGPGSRWIVTPNTIDNAAAGLNAGDRVGGQGTIDVRNGGKLIIDGSGGSGPNDFLNLGRNGGHGDLTVSGVGSSVEVRGVSPVIQVGRSGAGGQGSFSVLAGATASALFLNVGRDGANGDVRIDGAGSQMSLVGVGTGAAFAQFGWNSAGQGTVSNGGSLFISDGGADSRAGTGSPGINVGRDAGGNGKLTITGPGSTVQVVSTSLGLGAGVNDNYNPFVAVGRFAGASGELVVENGGKLLLQGNALSTVANTHFTQLHIGGSEDTSAGGNGKATVSGRGSEIRTSGSDGFITVGRGSGAVGELKILNEGLVSSTAMNVGRAGGTGTLLVDGATLSLSGQHTGAVVAGASLSIGNRGGTGVTTITNASRVEIVNLGTSGASLNLGGTGPNPLGNGTLTVAGASQINITAAPGLAVFSVGRDGTGTATIKDGSSVSVGDGSTFIGRLAGSNGNLMLQSGATLTAGYVGVGATPAGDGGTGRLIISNSVVNATTLEIGSAGFVGGHGGRINGDVILHGTLSPGESPGSIIINGRVRSASGHLILDVEADGLGGYLTDQLILTQGTEFSFPGLLVTFNFIGATDPFAFAASGGFDLDTFLLSLDVASGILSPLSDVFAPGQTWSTLFAGATFDAVSDGAPVPDLAVTPDGTVVFTVAAPIPEPETWALMFAGLAAIGAVSRRRAAAVRAGAHGAVA